jgi:predicted enzyme related to lactoylglutathione lyase
MTILLTVFGIACVGIVILLGSKLMEEKSGRRFFLPEWLAQRDDDIQRVSAFYAQALLWWLKHRARILAHILYRRAAETAGRIGNGTRMRPSGVLEKNGSASGYIQDIVAHKETARKENGHINE